MLKADQYTREIIGSAEMRDERSLIGAGGVEMPDLSELVGRNLPALLLSSMSGTGGPILGAYYLNALVRMTERAAYFYEQARGALAYAAGDLADDEFPLFALIRGTVEPAPSP